MTNPTDRTRHGSLGTGAVTAVALAVQTGLAAVVGVLIARQLGRTAETDGFFAAYGVFVVLALAATAIRVTVLPRFARASAEGRLAGEVGLVARAVLLVAVPAVLVCALARTPFAAVLTGFGPPEARAAAAEALPWMGVAAAGQLAAGILASACAALDDYVVPALAYIAGSVLGLVLIVARIGEDGTLAVAWGVTLNALVAASVPAVALVVRASRAEMPRSATRSAAGSVRGCLGELAAGTSIPLALQVVYLVCLPIAARSGVGAVSSFGYGYLLGSAVVTVTASSIGLVTSVPLTRAGLTAEGVARHLAASSWIALIATGATAGIFATAGSTVVSALLGDGYSADVGSELGVIIVSLVPWMIATIGVALVFPLVFVGEAGRRLLVIAGITIVVHVPLAIALHALAGLPGLAVAFACSTVVAVAGMLHLLRAGTSTVRSVAPVAATVAAFATLSYALAALVLGDVPAAVAGTLGYAALFALIRPRGLREAWRYLHRLA